MTPPAVKKPLWLANRVASHEKHVQSTLQHREYIRSTIRTFHLKGLPNEIPRQLFDYYSIAVDTGNKDRYIDIKPYDRTRVDVVDEQGIQRYLNANWCLERFGHKYWIASQAPLPDTAHAFLSLIRQPITFPSTAQSITNRSPQPTRVRTVVQLTRLREGGRRKAHSYFPTAVGQSVVHSEPGYSGEPLRATLIDSVDIADACCIKSTVSIVPESNPEDPVIFHHLLYTAWPDHGVPEPKDQAGLMAFLRLVDSTNRQASGDPDPPVIVGCSAGIGRTGTFIAISSLLRYYGFLLPADPPSVLSISSPLGPLSPAFDADLVAQEVDSLREQRPGMVQSNTQLELIYSLIGAAFD
ncbi:protein-tyrosine phosphatase-like protein [Mycena metata]|uniref:Protein-tyrosine phosphatase-like protein n=1 Tax=Mycena metata TaxID=1033252 RepID=A0AAD7MMI0_9AGAR|nr:protein-tyrosine phosphatase-like protein [Mycena metata]